MKEKLFAEIVPLKKLPKTLEVLDYSIPENFRDAISPGDIVEMPFRKNNISGVVIKIKKEHNARSAIKDIIQVRYKNFLLPCQIELGLWMSQYYFQSSSVVFKSIIPPLPKKYPGGAEDQKNLFRKLRLLVNHARMLNLGRGNSPYIMKEILSALKAREQILFLAPEISLVKIKSLWLKKNFPKAKILQRFGTAGKLQVFQAWQKIKNNKIDIICGTRKSVFLPFANLGLIIVLEEEHPSHKEWDQNPRYHARETAMKLAELTGAKIILQSLAPKAVTYAKTFKNFELISENSHLGNMEIADMQNEIKNKNFSGLSESLTCALQKLKGQAVLLAQTKGSSRYLLCRDCGYVPRCQYCERPFVYYEDRKSLECVMCENKRAIPNSCPVCKGQNISFRGKGSQGIEKEINTQFPKLRVARFESDILKKPREKILESFLEKRIDILIATTAIFEELPLDFRCEISAVLSADTILSIPDFQSSEKLWNIIARARDISKNCVIQTHHPEHPVFHYAQNNDSKSFYLQELALRKKFSYPPYSRFIKIIIQNQNEKLAQDFSEKIFRALKNKLPQAGIEILGPLKPSEPFIRGRFRRNILLKIKTPKAVPLNLRAILQNDVLIDSDPLTLL